MDLAADDVVNNCNAGLETIVLDLSGYQGVSTVDFRVYTTGGGVEYTDFQINSVVPESAAMVLLGLGSLLLRKRKYPKDSSLIKNNRRKHLSFYT